MHLPLTQNVGLKFFLRTMACLLLCIGAIHGLKAEPFELSQDMRPVAPVEYMTVLEDASGELSAANVISGAQDASFHSLPSGRNSVGITSSAWWIRFEVSNPTNTPVNWVINYTNPLIDTIDIYLTSDGHEGHAI